MELTSRFPRAVREERRAWNTCHSGNVQLARKNNHGQRRRCNQSINSPICRNHRRLALRATACHRNETLTGQLSQQMRDCGNFCRATGGNWKEAFSHSSHRDSLFLRHGELMFQRRSRSLWWFKPSSNRKGESDRGNKCIRVALLEGGLQLRQTLIRNLLGSRRRTR